MLAGRKKSSKVQESWAPMAGDFRGCLLTTRPPLLNLIPFAPVSQVTAFRGMGSNGQRVATRTARIAARDKAWALLGPAKAASRLFTERNWSMLSTYRSTLQLFWNLTADVDEIHLNSSDVNME